MRLRSPLIVFLGLFTPCLQAEEEGKFEPSPFATASNYPTRAWDGSDAKELDGVHGAAVRELLKAGLPDPKGLPYHEVGLPSGNCYDGDSGVVSTHGWLLPREEGGPQFVIGWNGLVYEAARVGKKLVLAEVVDALRKRKDEDLFGPFGWQQGEPAELLPGAVDGVHAVYLARLGFREAVQDLLKRRERAPGAGELMASAASQWAWHHYDRAVCAHMRGDSRLTLVSLRELKRVRPAVQKLIGAKGGPKGWAQQLAANRGTGLLQQGLAFPGQGPPSNGGVSPPANSPAAAGRSRSLGTSTGRQCSPSPDNQGGFHQSGPLF